jgi:hypothetical protein
MVHKETLTVEQVCTAMKLRGGFTGSYEDLVEHVKLYHNEVAYQLCDGYAVGFSGYFSIHPNVGGTFNKLREGVTEEKHPIDFRFRVNGPLHDLSEHIEVEVIGLADSGAFIEDFFDKKSGLYNQRVTPGGQFITTGNKIEIAEPSRDVGLFLVAPGSPTVAMPVTDLVVNKPHEIIGIIPELPPGKTWTLEARTQYTQGGALLKDVRTIASSFTLTEA